MHWVFSFNRSQNKSFLETVLSEESRIKRRRINKVNIQITTIAWSIEFATGLIACSLRAQSQNPDSSVELTVGIILIDCCLNFIIIPSIYLLNNENSKKRIIDEGWSKILGGNIQQHRVPSTHKMPSIEMVSAPKSAKMAPESSNHC